MDAKAPHRTDNIHPAPVTDLVKVTVVAWQYGLKGKVQTAEPVERSFYIYK